MASKEMGLVSTRRVENGLNPHHAHSHSQAQLVFQNSFSSGAPTNIGEPGPKTTRELSGFIDKYDNHHHHHYFNHQPQTADFHRAVFDGDRRDDHRDDRGCAATDGDGSEDEDEDDEDDDDNEDESEVEGLVAIENSTNSNVNGKVGTEKPKCLSAFGMKEGNVRRAGNDNNVDTSNVVTIADADGDMYYSQYLQETEVSNAGQKDIRFENGCGFFGRKEGLYTSESGESLRAILSDPITGALMDDAMILPCGHSFGSGGVQHAIRMKACCSCSQPLSENSVAPNLSLRAAIQAFRREEESQLNRSSSKRRRERYDQDKGTCGDSSLLDHPRGRGVQFPFVVTDRVMIKGNKRTPQRFVGREAVITTQCLNGWYVVKTLDNAESVKLQYRSLAKVSDNLSTQPMPSKMKVNWL